MKANLLPKQKSDTRFFGLQLPKKELGTGSIVFAICLVILALFHFALNAKVASEQAQLDDINSQIALLSARTNDVGQLSADVRRLQEIDRAAIWLRRSGQTTALRLAYIGNSIPSDAWIDRVAQDQKGWSIKGAGKNLPALSSVVRGISHVSPGLQTLFQAVNTDASFSYTMIIADPPATPAPPVATPDSILK